MAPLRDSSPFWLSWFRALQLGTAVDSFAPTVVCMPVLWKLSLLEELLRQFLQVSWQKCVVSSAIKSYLKALAGNHGQWQQPISLWVFLESVANNGKGNVSGTGSLLVYGFIGKQGNGIETFNSEFPSMSSFYLWLTEFNRSSWSMHGWVVIYWSKGNSLVATPLKKTLPLSTTTNYQSFQRGNEGMSRIKHVNFKRSGAQKWQ